MKPTHYWHDPEWRALLLAVVAEPEESVRRARCCDWLEERGENETVERWRLWQCEESEDGVNYTPVISERWQGTSAEWYQQDAHGVYPCKELAWTLPIREVVFVGNLSDIEVVATWKQLIKFPSEDHTRSELALRFARS